MPALQRDDDLICHFSIVSLDEPVIQYEALSYVWGTRMHNNRVFVQGEPIAVTENLYLALQNLRFTDKERILWVDALSINQSNDKERTHQVSLMSSIYKRAWNVVIWLGETFNDCDLAMDYLKQLGGDKNLHLNPSLSPSIRVAGESVDSVQIQNALKEFFSLPWWTRVWTVQEWVLGRQTVFQCGQQFLDGQIVRKSVRHFFHHRHQCCFKLDDLNEDSLFNCFLVMESMEYIRLLLNKVSFPYIISQFLARQATDMRDKVYGMLGLATGQYENLIEAEYSYSVEEVFEASTMKMIQRTGTLEVLSHIPTFLQRTLNLPSFVPDWTATVGDDPRYTNWLNWLGHLHLYDACRGEAADIKVIAPGRIAVKGIIVDEIESTGSEPFTVSYEALLQEMHDLADMDGDTEQIYCDTSVTRKVAFWLTICGSTENFLDPDRDNRPFFRRIPTPTDFSRFEKWEGWFPSHSVTLVDPDILSVHTPFSVMVKGRKFAVTKCGYMGFCPIQCKKGDVITVLAGGTVPFVLRPDESARKSGLEGGYTVIGDSYVHSIMDGEAVASGGEIGTHWKYLELS